MLLLLSRLDLTLNVIDPAGPSVDNYRPHYGVSTKYAPQDDGSNNACAKDARGFTVDVHGFQGCASSLVVKGGYHATYDSKQVCGGSITRGAEAGQVYQQRGRCSRRFGRRFAQVCARQRHNAGNRRTIGCGIGPQDNGSLNVANRQLTGLAGSLLLANQGASP